MKTNYQIKIIEHDLIMPEFFRGTAGVQLNIPVDKNSTVGDVLENLKQEIIEISNHIFCTFEKYGLDTETIGTFLRRELKSLEEECFDRMEVKPYENILDHSFEDYDEDMDIGCFPVVIFTIEIVEV